MKRLLQAGFLLLVLGFFFPGSIDARACGAFRSDVKTLTDPMAMAVNFTPQPITVEALGRLPRPAVDAHTPRLPQEQHAYRVKVRMLEVKQGPDGDFHVILEGTGGAKIMAGIPDPACARGSAEIIQLRTVRRMFVANYGQPDAMSFHPVRGQPTVMVYGVLFFDEGHAAQEGTAANGAMLYPVTAIK